ncbi:hypothetical protein REPUB_Repub15cG0019900 [Reevesia pubescens]
MDGNDSVDPKLDTADMTAFVQNLLQQMQSRFQTVSDSIITKIDEMGSRIDELQQSINDLRAEMGAETLLLLRSFCTKGLFQVTPMNPNGVL